MYLKKHLLHQEAIIVLCIDVVVCLINFARKVSSLELYTNEFGVLICPFVCNIDIYQIECRNIGILTLKQVNFCIVNNTSA